MINEEIDKVRLIYSREYYLQGNYEKGDQFLKAVEQSKNKSNTILKILDEVRRNKRFYFNRKNEDSKQLILTLQPKKTIIN